MMTSVMTRRMGCSFDVRAPRAIASWPLAADNTLVTLAFQHIARQMAHGRLIFHHQQGFRPARQRPGLVRSGRDIQRLLDSRKIDLEGRAFANLAVNADVTAGLLDDGLAGRQAQTGAFALGLGREKCLKQMRFDFLGHAGSRVTDAEHHVVAGNGAGVCARVVFIQRDIVGGDGQLAAVGHGIAGIDDQIHQHLPDVAGVGLDASDLFSGNNRHFDVLVNEPPQHFVQVFHHVIEVQHDGLHRLFAAEDQQLPGQPGGALGRRPNRLKMTLEHRVRAEFLHRQIAVTHDDRQDVVKVMRHAAGELADHFHFLRFDKLRLQKSVLRDILHHPYGEITVARRLARRADRQTRPNHLAVLANVALLHLVTFPRAPNQFLVKLQILGAILRMREREEGHPAQLLLRVAEHFLQGRVGQDRTAIHSDQRDPQGRFTEDYPQPLLGLQQRLLRPPIPRPFFDFLHGPAHRRSQPRQMSLQDIIGRAALERINGQFLPQHPGHEDQRYGRPSAAHHFCRRQPIKGGHREIRKDQVNASAFERRHKIILLLHQGGCTGDARGFQGELNERGIGWIILQVQNVEWGFHFQRCPSRASSLANRMLLLFVISAPMDASLLFWD